MLKEFKEFAVRGNVLDLAVGLIIGAAFGKIITSFVSDVLMPPMGLILGNVNFANLFVNLGGQHFATLEEAKKAGAATLNYGTFIQSIVDFVIVAFGVFLVVKQANRFRKPEDPVTKECPYCLSAVPLKAVRCSHCTSEIKVA